MRYFSIVDADSEEYILRGIGFDEFVDWLKNCVGLFIVKVQVFNRLHDEYYLVYVSNMKN